MTLLTGKMLAKSGYERRFTERIVGYFNLMFPNGYEFQQPNGVIGLMLAGFSGYVSMFHQTMQMNNGRGYNGVFYEEYGRPYNDDFAPVVTGISFDFDNVTINTEYEWFGNRTTAFLNGDFRNATFRNALGTGLWLKDCFLYDVDFVNCAFHGFEFFNCRMWNVRFAGCEAYVLRLDNCEVRNSDLTGIKSREGETKVVNNGSDLQVVRLP